MKRKSLKFYWRRWLYRSELLRWIRSWTQSRRLLRELYGEVLARGCWGWPRHVNCLTNERRGDGLCCAGVPREERWGVYRGREVCQYCYLTRAIEMTLKHPRVVSSKK